MYKNFNVGVTLIAAITPEGVIGKGDTLPWDIPEERKYFRDVTMNNFILMGRKTFESIGKPLEGRTNIILSRKKKFEDKNAFTFTNLEDAFAFAEKERAQQIFVIGGGSVYNQTIDFADRIILSVVKEYFAGDKFFPLDKLNGFDRTMDFDAGRFRVEFYMKI